MTQTKDENYYVNEQGDVFSTKSGNIKKLKACNVGAGYLKIQIWNNNKGKQIYVHRLVAETFIPNLENKPEVNHKNGIKTDNRVQNLEWSTPKENMDHAKSTGLLNISGETHGRAKVTEKQVWQIKELYKIKKYKQKELAKMFDISISSISLIVNKKNWKHL